MVIQSTIAFEKNDKFIGVCYDDIVRKDNVKYRIAISLYTHYETIKILDYSEKLL